MKKIQLSAAIVMLALASSCSKTDEMTNQEVSMPDTENDIFVITAKSTSSITRTELGGENGLSVLWQEGDAMNLYVKDITISEDVYSIVGGNDNTTGTMLSTKDSGGTTADFTTADGSAIPTIDTATGEVTYFALTPYQDNKLGDAAYSGGSEIKLQAVGSTGYVAIYFYVPATQSYVAGSYDPTVAFAYAKTDDISEGLSFNNLFGVLRLNLIGAEDQYVTSITVTSTSNLSGYVNAYTADDMEENSAYKLSAGGTTSTSITMDCTEGGNSDGVALSATATPFNIALLPVTSGLTINITYEVDGVSTTKSYTTSSAITRSVVTNMNDLDITPSAGTGSDSENFTEENGEMTEVVES